MKLATVCRRAAAAALIATVLATSAVPAFATTPERPPLDEVVAAEVDHPAMTTLSNHTDTKYTFKINSKNGTSGTSYRRKDDASSVYIKISSVSGKPLRIFVDGALVNNGYLQKDCTQGIYRARKKGEYGIYNTVHEDNKHYARLTAWAETGPGTVSGLWSPDSVGTLAVLGS